MKARSPIAAGAIAALLPGVGHAYAGHPLRGAAWLAGPVVAVIATALFARETSAAIVTVLFASFVCFWLVQIVDAVILAKRHPRESSPLAVGALAFASAIVVPAVFGIVTRASMLEAFKIPAGSMIPTLAVGDHIFVDKLVYRHRPPRRGEVVVFAYPEHRDQSFVKRVVGLPGDKIEVRGGFPIVNGWDVPHCLVGEYSYGDEMESGTHRGKLYVEFLDESEYFVLVDDTSYGDGYQGPYAFGDLFFVLGDNRNNSHDSRMWFGGQGGGVPRADVFGRARYQWLPHRRDYTAPLEAPTPALAPGLARCLEQRPPPEKRTAPPGNTVIPPAR